MRENSSLSLSPDGVSLGVWDLVVRRFGLGEAGNLYNGMSHRAALPECEEGICSVHHQNVVNPLSKS
jgi:hypothetical protein